MCDETVLLNFSCSVFSISSKEQAEIWANMGMHTDLVQILECIVPNPHGPKLQKHAIAKSYFHFHLIQINLVCKDKFLLFFILYFELPIKEWCPIIKARTPSFMYTVS